ncbi:MAG: hypothetical protein JWP88_1655 [Flaviaesturariibacter sp.]|nr:hypothetical protein [Flaviaesturariibacter sp.]
MKKAITTLFSVLLITSAVMAQDKTTTTNTGGRYSFFAELGGPGILFSANLDKRFNNTSLGFGARAGFGFVTVDDYQYNSGGSFFGRQISVATFPIQLNYVFGKGTSPHTFEVGGGITIAGRKIDIFNYYNNQGSSVFGTASFMYRRQPSNGGFSWRAGFTPIIGNGFIQPSAGLSVGYNFN